MSDQMLLKALLFFLGIVGVVSSIIVAIAPDEPNVQILTMPPLLLGSAALTLSVMDKL